MSLAVHHTGWVATLLAAALLIVSLPASAGRTLEGVRQHGRIACGVSSGLAGFSALDSAGEWRGLDADFCRALAAAVLGDPGKVRWMPLNAQQRFTALQAGEVDVLSRNTTWTLTRDASMGLHFAAITYHDGQGFMVPARSGVRSVRQLKGAEVCVQSGTTSEKNLTDFVRAQGIRMRPIVFESYEASLKAFFSGRCQAYTTDVSSLAAIRDKEARQPGDYAILPELISREPLGPAVRRGDDEWFAIVKWVAYALIEAEALGVNRANVETMRSSADPAVQRLLGTGGEDSGRLLGLDREWAYRAVRAVGNYGDVFERNLGAGSPLKLPRGANALWTQGGLMYAPPIR